MSKTNIKKAALVLRGAGLKRLLALLFEISRNQMVPTQSRDWNPVLITENSLYPELSEHKVLIVGHIYFAEFTDRFLDAVSRYKNCNWLVVATSSKQHILDDIKSKAMSRGVSIETLLVPNKGRNFAPLLEAVRNFGAGYEFLLHVHSKKSTHADRSLVDAWVGALWGTLIENPSTLRRLLGIMSENSNIAISYPYVRSFMPQWGYAWLSNTKLAKELLPVFDIKFADVQIPYPAGGMFCLRIESFRELFENVEKLGKFPDELGQLDGELHHFLERLVGVLPLERNQDHLIYIPSSNSFTIDHNYIFSGLSASSFSALTEICESSESISFDFFDTLYRRDVQLVENAKVLAGLALKPRTGMPVDEYVALRNLAEKHLREQSKVDVKLKDVSWEIAETLGLDSELPGELEMKFEYSSGAGRMPLVSLANSLARKGKRVFVISDTYYSGAFLATLAKKIGLDERIEIFTSSDLGARKDSGEIWPLLINDLKIAVNQHLHVGDNPHSDNQVPARYDIRSFLVLSAQDIWRQRGLGEWDQVAVVEPDKVEYLKAKLVSDFGESYY